MNTVSIRRARNEDAPAVASLLSELGYPSTAEEVNERLELFTTRGNGTLLVGDVNGQVVACAALVMVYPVHARGPLAHLSAFSVSEHYQRQGIGRSMIRFIESWARKKGCQRIVVTSAERREGAHEFYPAVGWNYTGRRYGKVLTSS